MSSAEQQQQQQLKKATATKDLSLSLLLQRIIARVPGLRAVLVSDKDGVTVERAGDQSVPPSSFVFGVTSEQLAKMPFGKCESIVATREDGSCLIHVNSNPLVITFVADPGTNIGVILSLAHDISRALEPISSAIESVTP